MAAVPEAYYRLTKGMNEADVNELERLLGIMDGNLDELMSGKETE